jgi:hypothetical protein
MFGTYGTQVTWELEPVASGGTVTRSGESAFLRAVQAYCVVKNSKIISRLNRAKSG